MQSTGAVGVHARVLRSSGRYSQRYIGRTGVAAMRLEASGNLRWVLKFAGSLLGNEEGLYDDDELEWHTGK